MLKNKGKKLLSLLLCAVLLMGTVPVSVHAEDSPAEPPAQTQQEPQQPKTTEAPAEQPQPTAEPEIEAEQPGNGAAAEGEAPAEQPGTDTPTEGEACQHSGGAASCTEAGVCAVCSAAYIEAAGHSYENGVCTVCSSADPDYKAPCEHSYEAGVCALCGESDPDYKAPCEHTYGEDGVCTLCGDIKPAESETDTEQKTDDVQKTGAVLKTTAPRLASKAITTPITVNIGTFDDKSYDGTTNYMVSTGGYTGEVDGQRLVISFTKGLYAFGHFADADVGSPKTFTIPADQYTATLDGVKIDSSSVIVTGTAGIKGNTLTASGDGIASGTYGQTLSEFKIDTTPAVSYEGTEIPGTWAPVDGTAKPDPGSSSHKFIFTPDENAGNYVPLTKDFLVETGLGDVKYPVSFGGYTVKEKVFDNSAVVELDLTNAEVSGLPTGFREELPAAASGTLESADAGTHALKSVDATITIRDLYTGFDVTDKFDISMDTTGITGTIKPDKIHLGNLSASSKTYDGSTAMSFECDSGVEYKGFNISFDQYGADLPGTYDTADAGDNKTFTVDPECYTVNNGAVASTNFILTGSGSIKRTWLTQNGALSISGEYGDKLSELDFSGLTFTGVNGEEVSGKWVPAKGQEDITLYTLGKTEAAYYFSFTHDSPNYFTYDYNYYVNVSPRKVNVSIVGNTETLTYDGNEHSVSGYTLQYADTVLKDTDIVFSGEAGTASGKNAGTYTAAETLSAEDFSCSSEYFDLSFSVANQTSLTINKAPLTITANDVDHYPSYSSVPIQHSCRYEGFVNGEDESVLTVKPSFSDDYSSLDGHLASCPIHVFGAEAANYDISYVDGTLTQILHAHTDSYKADGLSIIATCDSWHSLCPLPVRSATLSAADVVYTGEPATAVTKEGNFAGASLKIRYTGAEGTEYESSEVAPTDVGRYTVTMSIRDSSDVETSVSTQFSILHKDIANCTVELPVSEFTYSGTEPKLNLNAVNNAVGSTPLMEGVDYELSGIGKDAGNYTLTVTGIGNYTGQVEIPYEIKKAELYFSVVTSPTKEYDGTADCSNALVLSDTLPSGLSFEYDAVYTSSSSGKPVSSVGNNHIVNIKNIRLSGEDAENYRLCWNEYPDRDTTDPEFCIGIHGNILTREITVKPEFLSKEYGDADPEIGYEVDRLVEGDTLSGALSRDNGENVGFYPIKIGTLANPNYNITLTDTMFAITQREITVSGITTIDKVYDGSTMAALGDGVPSYSNIPKGENPDFRVKVEASYDSADAGNNKPISIKFVQVGVAEGYKADNYMLKAEPLYGNISPAAVKVTVSQNCLTKAFGETDPSFTYSTEPATDADGKAFELKISRAAGETVGKYDFVIEENYNNYQFVTDSSFEILPLYIKVRADKLSKAYGSADPELSYRAEVDTQLNSANISNDALQQLIAEYPLSGKLSRDEGEMPRIYDIDMGTLNGGENYRISSFYANSFTIEPAQLTLTGLAPVVRPYNGKNEVKVDTSAAQLSGLPAGHRFELPGNINATLDGDTAGSHKVESLDLSELEIFDASGRNVRDCFNVAFDDSLTATIEKFTVPVRDVEAFKGYDGTVEVSNVKFTPIERWYVGCGVLTLNRISFEYDSAAAGTRTLSISDFDISLKSLIDGKELDVDSFEMVLAEGYSAEIGPYFISVTADSLTKVYGQDDPELTYTISSGQLFGSDTLSGAPGRKAGEDVGEYAIDIGTLANPNYNISFDSGAKLTITPFEINEQNTTLTVSDKVYTGDRLSGLDALSFADDMSLTEGVDYTLSGSTGTALGTYTLRLEGMGNCSGIVEAEWKVTPPAILDYIMDGTITEENVKDEQYAEIKFLQEALHNVGAEQKDDWKDKTDKVDAIVKVLEDRAEDIILEIDQWISENYDDADADELDI